MKASSLAMLIATVVAPWSWAAAQAPQINYNYLQVTAAVTRNDTALGEELDGLAAEINGNYEILDILHVFGGYAAGELDDEPLETSTIRAGIGVDFDVSAQQSVYFDLAAVSIDTDLITELGTVSSDVDGYGASIGYRERNHTRLEFTASLDYVEYSDLDDSNTSLTTSLQYELTPRWRLEGGVTFGGDNEAWRFGARYYFRPPL